MHLKVMALRIILFLLSLLAVVLAWSECPSTAVDDLCNGVQSNEFAKVSLFLGQWSTSGEVLNAGVCGGLTPLALASAMGHLSIVETLLMLDNVVDVNVNIGGTALLMAASEGQTAVVEMLLKTNNIDVNSVEVSTGGNALQAAALLGHTEIVRLLLQVPGIDVNWQSGEEMSALMMAARGGHAAIVNLLLTEENDVNINAVDKAGDNVLTTVLGAGNSDLASTIMKSPKLVNVNQKNNAGFTPLMLASLLGMTSTVDELLHKNADVNSQGSDGWTPLLYAIAKSHTDIVKLLAAVKGLNISAECKQGWTATSLASHLQLEDVADILESLENAY